MLYNGRMFNVVGIHRPQSDAIYVWIHNSGIGLVIKFFSHIKSILASDFNIDYMNYSSAAHYSAILRVIYRL